MKNKILWIGFLVLVAGVALVATACVPESYKANGGGWFVYNTDDFEYTTLSIESKVTFGFHMDCEVDEENPDYDIGFGQFQYNDHGLGIKFHGVLEAVPNCGSLQDWAPVSIFAGTYTPQPKKRAVGGYFAVYIEDGGKPGPSSEDYIEIELQGGDYDGYKAGGTLGGGNIKIFNK